MVRTRLSNKGQIVIPKGVRVRHGWKAGLEFVIVNLDDGIALKPIKPYRETNIEDVIGCMGYSGPTKSLEDMEAAIAKGVREQA